MHTTCRKKAIDKKQFSEKSFLQGFRQFTEVFHSPETLYCNTSSSLFLRNTIDEIGTCIICTQKLKEASEIKNFQEFPRTINTALFPLNICCVHSRIMASESTKISSHVQIAKKMSSVSIVSDFLWWKFHSLRLPVIFIEDHGLVLS